MPKVLILKSQRAECRWYPIEPDQRLISAGDFHEKLVMSTDRRIGRKIDKKHYYIPENSSNKSNKINKLLSNSLPFYTIPLAPSVFTSDSEILAITGPVFTTGFWLAAQMSNILNVSSFTYWGWVSSTFMNVNWYQLKDWSIKWKQYICDMKVVWSEMAIYTHHPNLGHYVHTELAVMLFL